MAAKPVRAGGRSPPARSPTQTGRHPATEVVTSDPKSSPPAGTRRWAGARSAQPGSAPLGDAFTGQPGRSYAHRAALGTRCSAPARRGQRATV